MREDAVISALIGLVGACGNNPKTADTDRLVVQALAFPALCPEYDDGALQRLVDRIHAEKYAVSPGCAVCTAPCGNTSDYDMRRLYEAQGAVRAAKLRLLERLQRLAPAFCRRFRAGGEPAADIGFFYKALCYIGCDVNEAALQELLNEADKIENRIEREESGQNGPEDHSNR